MKNEDYVSFEVAKLLKQKGFNELVDSCYGIAVRHNGEDIDEDEEYELKSAGREDEIEYVDGGMVYQFWTNNQESKDIYSRPSLWTALKWLRDVHKMSIMVDCIGEQRYEPTIQTFAGNDYEIEGELVWVDDVKRGFKTYERATEMAIKWCLENLIK